jgi:hypothetical protein
MCKEYLFTHCSERKTDTELFKLAREFINSELQKRVCNCCNGNHCDCMNGNVVRAYV